MNRLQRSYYLVLVLLCLTGMGVVLYATRQHGGGLTLDSVHYIAVARNLLSGNGFISFDQLAYIVWPPLYPLLLAASSLIAGMDVLAIVPVVNSALFGLIIFLTGLLFARHLSSRVLALLGTAVIATSSVMLSISVMTLTEPLFVCCTLWFLLSLHAYMAKQSRVALISIASVAALAFLTRYMGISLVWVGMLTILLVLRKQRKRLVTHELGFAAISLLPNVVWLIRNYVLSGNLFGPRAYPLYGIADEVAATLHTMAAWYIPGRFEPFYWVFYVILAGIGLLAVRIALKHSLLSRLQLHSVSGVALTVAIYTSALVFTSSSSTNALISDRYLSPIYVPVLLLLFILAEVLSSSLRQRLGGRIVQVVLLGSVTLWLAAFPVRYLIISLAQDKPFGSYAYWYQNPDWRDGRTLTFARTKLKADSTPIYTNGPDLLYLNINRFVNGVPPNPNHTSRLPVIKPYIKPGAWPPESQAYLIWFQRIDWRFYLHSREELQMVANMELLWQFDDGAIYKLTPRR